MYDEYVKNRTEETAEAAPATNGDAAAPAKEEATAPAAASEEKK